MVPGNQWQAALAPGRGGSLQVIGTAAAGTGLAGTAGADSHAAYLLAGKGLKPRRPPRFVIALQGAGADVHVHAQVGALVDLSAGRSARALRRAEPRGWQWLGYHGSHLGW